MSETTDLLKAHVKGYSRKDGVYVRPHDRAGMPSMTTASKPVGPVHYHPRRGENGEKVIVKTPTMQSLPSTWHNPRAVATFVPDGDAPASINNIPLTKWRDHPQTNMGGDFCDGINEDLEEPDFLLPPGKKAGSGVVIEEPDGRVWVIAPTNAYGGYETTFPKGTAEPDLSLQGNALKECFEEAGLQVEITGFIGDFARTTSVARMYSARRVGGTPIAASWESQGVMLVPRDKLRDMLNMWSDQAVVDAIAGETDPSKVAAE